MDSRNQFSSLVRLQFRQFFRGKKKKDLVGLVISIVYFWVIQFVLFFMARDEGVDFPPVAVMLVMSGFIVPDFIFKLFIQHDNTVMDAFLKTRPISQSIWDRFLSLSHFWTPTNLMMPLMMAPACFLFLPLRLGITELLILYLASVFGGFLIMLIKHRGSYQSEKQVSARTGKTVKAGKGSGAIGLQVKSVLRSKKMKTMLIYLGILFYIQYISYSLDHDRSSYMYLMFLFYYIYALSALIPQYGFCIEANFFAGLWTRPTSVFKLLNDKYWFGIILGALAVLTCLPVAFWTKRPMMDSVSFFLYVSGFVNMGLLVDAYKSRPIDLFGKTFFNYQGSQNTFKGTSFVILLVAMAIGVAVPLVLPGWKSQAILSALGVVGFLVHRPFFRWVEGRFLKDRYKYMEKYTSI